MRWIPLLLILSMPVKATTLDVHLMGVTNHTEPGVTAADEPEVDVAPGLTVPAYNERNWGIAIGMSRKNTWWMFGSYKNSFWTRSRLFLSGVGVNVGPYLIGLSAGFVDGYDDKVEAAGFAFIKTDTITVLVAPEGYHLMATLYSWDM
jgi:hypothetical protein